MVIFVLKVLKNKRSCGKTPKHLQCVVENDWLEGPKKVKPHTSNTARRSGNSNKEVKLAIGLHQPVIVYFQ